MHKGEVLNRIRSEGLIPVVRVATSQEAMEVADALRAGGASLIEITMTVQGALDAIRELTRRYNHEVIVGAGTVLDEGSAEAALQAGARFLVSPAFDPGVIRAARDAKVVVVPGAMTPTEILGAWKAGGDLVKVFPAAQLGGPDYVKALKGPLPQIPLVPTGGVNLQNVGAFIRAGAEAVGAGGELLDKRMIKEKNFQGIIENTKAFLRSIQDARPGE